jgi:hypothetical protein
MSNIGRLLAISGSSLGPTLRSSCTHPNRTNLGQEIRDLLKARNGFFAFESALQVFPCCTGDGDIDASRWNDPSIWRSSYGDLVPEDRWFFGQDVFGNQFGLSESAVVRLDAETGAFESVASSLEGWAALVLSDFSYWVGFRQAHEWQVANGALTETHRLVPKKPFVLGGEYDTSNLFAMDAVRSLRMRGETAVQLAGLPEGTPVEIVFKNYGD